MNYSLKIFNRFKSTIFNFPLLSQLNINDLHKAISSCAISVLIDRKTNINKLDITTIGYQLSGLEIRHSRARPKFLDSNPPCVIVNVHSREVPY